MKLKQILFFSTTISILFFVAACSRGNEEKKIAEESANVSQVATDSTFIFNDFHLAIDAPHNWKSQKIDSNVFAFQMDCDTGKVFCPNLVARFVSFDEEITLDHAAELFIGTFRSKYKKFDPFSVLDKEVNGKKMVVIDYKIFENETDLGGTTAIVLLGDKKRFLTLSMMAENKDGGYFYYRLLFESVLNTLRPM